MKIRYRKTLSYTEYIIAMGNAVKLVYWQVMFFVIEFNPTKTEKTVITIRIEATMLKEVDELSDEVGISRNEFILQCIGFAMAHYPKIEKADEPT